MMISYFDQLKLKNVWGGQVGNGSTVNPLIYLVRSVLFICMRNYGYLKSSLGLATISLAGYGLGQNLSFSNKLQVLHSTSIRLKFKPPVEPPFGGDDGEPETAEPSFVWGYLIDKHRYRLGETKKMQFEDDYLTFLMQPNWDKYQRMLRLTYAAELLLDPEYNKLNQKILRRQNPFEFGLLDRTEKLKRIKMAELPPSGVNLPNRNIQMSRFLASNPESRIQILPQLQQLGGFIGGRTPYSWGSVTDRNSLGFRQANKIYQFMEKVSDTNVKFMGSEATNGIWRLGVEQEPIPTDLLEEPITVDDVRYDWDTPTTLFYRWRWYNSNWVFDKVWETNRMRSLLNSVNIEENRAYVDQTDLAWRFIEQITPRKPLTLGREIDFNPGHLPLRDTTANWPATFRPKHSSARPKPIEPLSATSTFESHSAFLEVGQPSLTPKMLPTGLNLTKVSRVNFNINPLSSIAQLFGRFGQFKPIAELNQALDLLFHPHLLPMGPLLANSASNFSGSVARKSAVSPTFFTSADRWDAGEGNWSEYVRCQNPRKGPIEPSQVRSESIGYFTQCKPGQSNSYYAEYFRIAYPNGCIPEVTPNSTIYSPIYLFFLEFISGTGRQPKILQYSQTIERPLLLTKAQKFNQFTCNGVDLSEDLALATKYGLRPIFQRLYALATQQRMPVDQLSVTGETLLYVAPVPATSYTFPTSEFSYIDEWHRLNGTTGIASDELPVRRIVQPNVLRDFVETGDLPPQRLQQCAPRRGTVVTSEFTNNSEMLQVESPLDLLLKGLDINSWLDSAKIGLAELYGKTSNPINPCHAPATLSADLQSQLNLSITDVSIDETIESLTLSFQEDRIRRDTGFDSRVLYSSADRGIDLALIELFQSGPYAHNLGDSKLLHTFSLTAGFESLTTVLQGSGVGIGISPASLYTSILTDTFVPLPNVGGTGKVRNSDIFSNWLQCVADSAFLPRLLTSGAFYSQRGLLDLCTLRANQDNVGMLVLGANSTLAQLISAMRVLIPAEQLNTLLEQIRVETLTQLLEFVEKRAKLLATTQLKRLFNQLPEGSLSSSHLGFSKLNGRCLQSGFNSTLTALGGINVDYLLQLLTLKISLKHFQPHLTQANFNRLSGLIGPVPAETLALAKAYVSHNSSLFANFTNFANSVKSWAGFELYLPPAGVTSPDVIISHAGLVGAVIRLEQFLAQQGVNLGNSIANPQFISLYEQEKYRLFILDYCLMRLLTLGDISDTAKVQLTQTVTNLIQVPVLSVIEALRAVDMRHTAYPALLSIGFDTTQLIGSKHMQLDNTKVEELGDCINAIANSKNSQVSAKLISRWVNLTLGLNGEQRAEALSAYSSAAVDELSEGLMAKPKGHERLAEIVTGFMPAQTQLTGPNLVVKTGTDLFELANLSNPTWSDFYTETVDFFFNAYAKKQARAELMSHIHIPMTKDLNAVSLVEHLAVTNMVLERPQSNLGLSIISLDGVGNPYLFNNKRSGDTSAVTALEFLAGQAKEGLVVTQPEGNAFSLLCAKLYSYLMEPLANRTVLKTLFFEQANPDSMYEVIQRAKLQFSFKGLPKVGLSNIEAARNAELGSFYSGLASRVSTPSVEDLGIFYLVNDSADTVHADPLSVNSSVLQLTQVETSLKAALVENTTVSRVAQFFISSFTNTSKNSTSQVELTLNTMLRGSHTGNLGGDIELFLHKLGYSGGRISPLVLGTKFFKTPREFLALFHLSFTHLCAIPQSELSPSLAANIPTILTVTLPSTAIVPIVLGSLPENFKFNYNAVGAKSSLIQAWASLGGSLSEKCQAAILRVGNHYNALTLSRSLAGQSLDITMAEFSVLGYTLNRLVTQISAAETFEIQTDSPSVQMQELAQTLFLLELGLADTSSDKILTIGKVEQPSLYDSHSYMFGLEFRDPLKVGKFLGVSLNDIQLGLNSQTLEMLDVVISKLSNYTTEFAATHLNGSVCYTPGTLLNPVTAQATSRLAYLTHKGFEDLVGINFFSNPSLPIRANADVRELSQQALSLQSLAESGQTQVHLQSIFEMFSDTLTPQVGSTYLATVEKLGKIVADYHPRLVSKSTFLTRWSDVSQRSALVYELIFFSLASAIKKDLKFALVPGSGIANSVMVGHLLRQAIFAYELGGFETRCQIERFWYNLAVSGKVAILETDVNVEHFNLVHATTHTNSKLNASCFDQSTYPFGGLRALSAVLRNERPGIVGYLSASNPSESALMCVTTAITIALSLDETGANFYSKVIAPQLLRSILSIDASVWLKLLNTPLAPTVNSYDPIYLAAHELLKIRLVGDVDTQFEHLGQSLLHIRELLNSTARPVSPYLPVWEYSTAVLANSSQFGANVISQQLGPIWQALDSYAVANYSSQRNQLFAKISLTDLRILPLVDLVSPSKSVLPNNMLAHLLHHEEQATLGDIKRPDGDFVILTTPISLNGISVERIPTPTHIWGQGAPLLPLDSYSILGPLLVKAFLEKYDNWDLFFKTQLECTKFLSSLPASAGVLDLSISGSLGWAKYNRIFSTPEVAPELSFLQHLTPNVKEYVLTLYELASTTVSRHPLYRNFPIEELTRWVYQWVWEFTYKSNLSFDAIQGPLEFSKIIERDKFLQYIDNKCTTFLLTPTNEAFSIYGKANSQIDSIACNYLNNTLLEKKYNQPEEKIFGQQVNNLMSALFPDQGGILWADLTALDDKRSGGDAAKKNIRNMQFAGNLQTVSNTLDSYWHTTAPIDAGYAKQTTTNFIPQAECYIPQNTKPKQPRVFGRDVFNYRDHTTANPQATWVKTLRRMQELSLEGTTETTTMWRFVAWLERRKWERQIELNSVTATIVDWLLQSPLSGLWATWSEFQASEVTAGTALIAYLNYWHTRFFIPLLYLKRRIWEVAELTHKHYLYSMEILERPQDKFDQLYNLSDWSGLLDAILDYSIFHDLAILGGVFGLPTLIYYFHLIYTARSAVEEGLYQRNALYVPLNYLERFDWTEVSKDRDTDNLITEHFPDFNYMRQDQIYPNIHQDQELKTVEYDHLWCSTEPNPQLDIFYGPRYVDEDALCETYETVGYKSPPTSEIVPTQVTVLNEYAGEHQDGYIDTFHELAEIHTQKDRLTSWWKWDTEITPFGNLPGIDDEEYADIAYINYKKTFFNQLNSITKALIWLTLSTSWLWMTFLLVILAEVGMLPEHSMWNYTLDFNTLYSPQFWFEYLAVRAMVPVRLKSKQTIRFHMLEYIEYTLPTNMHRPDLHAPIFDAMERDRIRGLYSLNFGLNLSDLTPEDMARIIRGTYVPSVYSVHWNLEGNAAIEQLAAVKAQTWHARKLRNPLSELTRRFTWDEINWFFNNRRGNPELKTISKISSPEQHWGTSTNDTFQFFNKFEFMPKFYEEKTTKNEKMSDSRWFIHNMKNAAFVNTHTHSTKRRRRILHSKTTGQWDFDKEWFGAEFSPYLHEAMRFTYGPDSDIPTGAEINDDYFEAWENELETLNYDQKTRADPRVAIFDKPTKIHPRSIRTNALRRKALVADESDMRDVPRGQHSLDIDYPEFWEESELLKKYQVWEPLYSGAYDMAIEHGDSTEGIATYNRHMWPWRKHRRKKSMFARIENKAIFSFSAQYNPAKRGGYVGNPLKGLYVWALHKLTPKVKKLPMDQASQNDVSQSYPGVWVIRHYQKKLKSRKVDWRSKHHRRSELHGTHVPRDDSAADSLTNFGASTFNWESQFGGEETTKPHYHWFFDTASDMFDHGNATHTSELPVTHPKIQELLWTLRYWETPLGAKFQPSTEVDILALNEQVLKNQGIADLWTFADNTQSAESMYARQEYLRGLVAYSEKAHVPPIRTWDAAVPIVNPFWWDWRARAARLILQFVPDTWYGRAGKVQILKNLHLGALAYTEDGWRKLVDDNAFTASELVLETKPFTYSTVVDELEDDFIDNAVLQDSAKTIRPAVPAKLSLLKYAPLPFKSLVRHKDILDSQQRLFKLLNHSRVLVPDETAGDVDSDNVSEFTAPEESLSFWQTFKLAMDWVEVSDAEFVSVQLKTLAAIKELDDSLEIINASRMLLEEAQGFNTQVEREPGLSVHVRSELRKAAKARLQFAIENATVTVASFLPTEYVDDISEPYTKPSLELINDENWQSVRRIVSAIPNIITKAHNDMRFSAQDIRFYNGETAPLPYGPNLIKRFAIYGWHLAWYPIEVFVQFFLALSRVIFAFGYQIRMAVGLDGRTRDEWKYHLQQVNRQNRVAKKIVSKFFKVIRDRKFFQSTWAYLEAAWENLPTTTAWTPYNKLLRATRRLKTTIKTQWLKDTRIRLQYKQTILNQAHATPTNIILSHWYSPLPDIAKRWSFLSSTLSKDLMQIDNNRKLYRIVEDWLSAQNTKAPIFLLVAAKAANFLVLGIPHFISTYTQTITAIVFRGIKLMGYVTLYGYRAVTHNSLNLIFGGLHSIRYVIPLLSKGLTYLLYYTTSTCLTAISFVKTSLILVEWMATSLLTVTSGTLLAVKRAVFQTLTILFWPLAVLRDKITLAFVTYIKIIKLLDQPKTKRPVRRKKPKAFRYVTVKSLIRYFSWWSSRQFRRVRAAKSAVEYAFLYNVKPYSKIPGKVVRWGFPYVKWVNFWFLSPILRQFNGASTRQRNPEKILWCSQYYSVYKGKVTKPNLPEWSKQPRKKKSGGMRPSRWRAMWHGRPRDERLPEVPVCENQPGYSPISETWGLKEEQDSEPWWPFK